MTLNDVNFCASVLSCGILLVGELNEILSTLLEISSVLSKSGKIFHIFYSYF